MYRAIKKDTVEPRYFCFFSMNRLDSDDGYIYIWEADERKASLFTTKQEAIEALWRCGFSTWEVDIEKV